MADDALKGLIQMNELFESHVSNLTMQLDNTVMEYLKKNFNDEINLSFGINIIISGYLSSLNHVLQASTQDNLKASLQTQEMMKKILNSIGTMKNINQIYEFEQKIQ